MIDVCVCVFDCRLWALVCLFLFVLGRCFVLLLFLCVVIGCVCLCVCLLFGGVVVVASVRFGCWWCFV